VSSSIVPSDRRGRIRGEKNIRGPRLPPRWRGRIRREIRLCLNCGSHYPLHVAAQVLCRECRYWRRVMAEFGAMPRHASEQRAPRARTGSVT
jgi:hypothetical protein